MLKHQNRAKRASAGELSCMADIGEFLEIFKKMHMIQEENTFLKSKCSYFQRKCSFSYMYITDFIFILAVYKPY